MKKQSVFILGAGLIGKPMADDLAANEAFEVGIADISADALQAFEGTRIKTFRADLRDSQSWLETASNYDFFINAVPGFMGYATLKALISLGKPIVDIAFYPEDPLALDKLARDAGSCVICDMGVAPGMSHLLSGYAASKLREMEHLVIYVGGLPVTRTLPWQYKAVFSPSDVIEEYTRPARLIEYGKLIEKEALSDSELINFEPVGTLEAFNSDGLRSLVYTLKANFMAEKTLRYPGHIELIRQLKKSGFFSEEITTVSGQTVVPLEFTKALLFKQWKLEKGEADLTVMRVMADGTNHSGSYEKITFDLYDQPDPSKMVHSMARTTGYAATSALRLLAAGKLTKAGIHMPEFLGMDEEIVDFMLKDQQERNIHYRLKVEN